MPDSLPTDFDFVQVLAICFLFATWFSYTSILKTVSRGSLNEQLSTVRALWIHTSIRRTQKPFDAILLGHMVNSISFFGSATMLVLAGLVTLFANVGSVYEALVGLSYFAPSSFEAFAIVFAVMNVILALSFFAFTYALRKLIYVLALVGALPEGDLDDAQEKARETMATDASIVLSEALKTFNFGIRGYYYFVAALGLLVSPFLCIALNVIVTVTLMYRQVGTVTAKSIRRYVEATELQKERVETGSGG